MPQALSAHKEINVDVCIVGGGIAGLAVACAFRQAGASVVVVERRIETGDRNRGDWLHPRSVALLRKWGVDLQTPDPQRADPLQILNTRVESSKKVLTQRSLGAKEYSVCLPASQTEGRLRDSAKKLGVDVRMGWQAQMLLQPPGENRIGGLTALGDGKVAVFHTKLVIGADGRASWVRGQIGLKLRPAETAHETVTFEAELAGTRTAGRPDAVVFSVGPSGGGLMVPISVENVRVCAVAGMGEGDSLLRKSPEEFSREISERSPLPPGSVIDRASLRSYENAAAGHAQNYAANGAVCIGDAAHPLPIPSFRGIEIALMDAEALARIVAPQLKTGGKAIDQALTKFETERWPENEKEISRAVTAVRWLLPLEKARMLVARSPLGGLSLKALTATD